VGYTPRRFARSPLYRLVQDQWDSFLSEYDEQFQHRYGSLRSVIERVVPRFLDCGNPMNGFARIRCGECGHERLHPVIHHHVVFTLPKMLRVYFRYDEVCSTGSPGRRIRRFSPTWAR
jgi:hypothetical protein